MAEINLKQYLAKLDTLLKDNANDEAVYNARHILQVYPKNAATYRKLGEAYSQESRWDNAGDALRRVLSVFPDDYETHIALGEVYQRSKKLDEAIWHFERAFEQDPNNGKLIEILRELYRTHRNIEQVKIPLTTGAAARQYARNGLFDQAVNVLQKTLNQAPDRTDLRLLLARILMEAARTVEAAEVALDVLAVLPDCLEANYILAELWLHEQRPSDAQRYLSRMEAVDPYLALELAQGSPPPDNVIELEELDYQSVAHRDLTSDNPDWLLQIDDDNALVGEDDSLFDLTDDWLESPDNQSDAAILDDDFDLSDDWLTDEAPAALEKPVTSAAKPEKDEWLSQFGDTDESEEKPAPRKRTGMTGMLSALKSEEPEPTPTPMSAALPAESESDEFEDLSKLFDDDDDFMAAPAEAEDPLAWLEESGVEILDDELPKPRPVTSEMEDPLAWLQGSGVEILDDETEANFDAFGVDDDGALQAQDAADPMAWLRGSGVEVMADTIDAEDDLENAAEADPLAWLQASGVQIVDDTPPVRKTQTQNQPVVPAPVEEPSAWLEDDTLLEEMMQLESLSTGELYAVDADDMKANVPGEEAAAALDGQEDMSDNEDFASWFDADSDDSDSADSGLEWLEEEADDSETYPIAADASESFNLFDDDEDEALDWMREPESELPDQQPVINLFDDDEEDALDWGSELAAAPSSDSPAWLSESGAFDAEPALFGESDDEFAWDTEAAESVPTAQAQVPDWLSSVSELEGELGTEDNLEEEPEPELLPDTPSWLSAAAPIADDDLEMGGEATEEEFAWANALTLDEEASALASDVPDWLSDVNVVASEKPISEPEPALFGALASADDEESELDWAQFEEDDQPEEFAVAEATPSWLSDMNFDDDEESTEDQPAPEPALFGAPASAEGDDESQLDWAQFEEDDQPEEFAVAEATPSWLSDLNLDDDEEESEDQPAPEPALFGALDSAEGDDESQLDWAQFEEDDQPEEFAVAEATPSWLSDLNFDDDESAQDEDQPEEFAVAEATPSWLSDMNFDADEPEDEPDAKPEPVTFGKMDSGEEVDALDWGQFDDDQVSIGLAEDAPSWLADLNAPDDEEEFAFYAEENTDEMAVAGEAPDWLAAAVPDEENVEIEEPVNQFGWMSDIDESEAAARRETYELDELPDNGLIYAEETEPFPADNAPDWLNAMVPGLDVDYAAEEDAQVESDFAQRRAAAQEPTPQAARRAARDFAWLEQIVGEELRQPPTLPETPGSTSKRRFNFSKPPAWLRRLTGRTEKPAAVVETVDVAELGDDLPPWLSYDDLEDES